MEAGEVPNRQSSTPSTARPENVEPRHAHHSSSTHNHATPSEPPARQFREPRNMASTAVASPAAPYHGHSSFHHVYSSAHSGGPGASMSGIISPIEPRRPSNDSDNSHRQSLPSLSEIMLAEKHGDPFPHSAPTSAPCPSSSTFPSPFNSTRTFSDPQHTSYPPHEGHSSPQPVHPPPSAFQSRHDVDRFPDPSRPPLHGRPGSHGPQPPVPSYTSPRAGHQSPPTKHESTHRPLDQAPRPSPGGLPHPSSAHSQHHQNPPHSSYPHHPPQLPLGQLPLPGPRHPLSPGYGSAHATPSYEHPPSLPPPRGRYGEPDFDGRSSQSSGGVDRALEQWGYQENLGRIIAHSRTIYNFAEAYGNIAQEQQNALPILQRLPSERELAEMLNNVDLIRKSLESTREIVQVTLQNERQREVGKGKGAWDEDHDMAMYETSKNTFTMPEVKKRRGRAAPPGRCHSCNRVDTPEWRRGPDGARTLCNACGLHYAKLERKRQTEMRNNNRPKQMDD
jgi:hypothetical protein